MTDYRQKACEGVRGTVYPPCVIGVSTGAALSLIYVSPLLALRNAALAILICAAVIEISVAVATRTDKGETK